ncbi:MAG: maleylpyruvate isomerase N-terminal domain-containing protein [Candidatus Rokubacteria bacterium]|nr:maleylpyruvate isomerase N-terminal domain-containing protein [Candidatus Rokubacteria bacterium]
MAVDRSYIAQNAAQRERLRALVDRLTDEELRRPLSAGWTIAGVLAHVAFWDQRVLVLLQRWERDGSGSAPPPIDPDDIDWINDTAKALCLALPPRAAAELALATAEAVDRKVAALPDHLLAANAAAGSPINLLRAAHRREHLDEIERALPGEGRGNRR